MKNTQFTYPEAVQRIERLGGKPIAVEAQWDGDTQGWFLMMFVVITIKKGILQSKKIETHHLGNISLGDDFRVFNGTVPPYPEATLATEIGEQLEKRFGLEFFFPSPQIPDDGCPRWIERDKAINCADCSKLIIPSDSPHLPKDICYSCHRNRKRNEKIKKDEIYNSTSMYLVKDGIYRLVGGATYFDSMTIAPFIEHMAGQESPQKGVRIITLNKEDIVVLLKDLEKELESVLSYYKEPDFDERLKKFISVSTMEYKGKVYELMDRFNKEHQKLSLLIHAYDTAKMAVKEGLVYKIHINNNITCRDDSILRYIYKSEGHIVSIDSIQEHYKGILSPEEVKATLEALKAINCIYINKNDVSLTQTGSNIL